MCCSRVRVLEESLVETEDTQVEMDSPTELTVTPGSVPSLNEDHPRLKFLCSFNGSILPRPQDGKLRYVGGETRIVSVPRDIGFEELMTKMKELFEGANVLKYQQPDEDLDALVSVVNDDDVTNMMEDYEKLGSGDGFTRLRIFLFSSVEQDDTIHFVDMDERDNERRYVDALNSHNDQVDDVQLIDQYYNQLSLDGNLHNQRNFEMSMMGVNLRHVTIPHQQSPSQKYSEMESPWSPAYYSPRHDFPNSPSSSRYHTPYGDQVDRNLDRVPPDDYFRQQQQHFNHQPQYDQQPPLPQNAVWLPATMPPIPMSGDKAGFPGNILSRNEAPDIPNLGNGYMSNPETKFPHPFYGRDKNDPRSHNLGGGRYNDHYIVDGNGTNMNLGHTAYPDGNHVSPHYVHHEDRPHYIRHGPEFGNEVFHDVYGAENLYHPSSHGHGNFPNANAIWRNGQSSLHGHGHPPYEASSAPQQENGLCNIGYIRTARESSPRVPVGVENQNLWADSSPKMVPIASNLENQQFISTEPVQYTPTPMQFKPEPVKITPDPVQFTLEPIQSSPEFVQSTPEPVQIIPDLNCLLPSESRNYSISKNSVSNLEENDGFGKEKSNSPAKKLTEPEDNAPTNKDNVVQPIESVNKAELEGSKEVRPEGQDDAKVKEETVQELEAVDAAVELGVNSGSDNKSNTKIEPTKAEEEAISRGLQTIKNDDLEEIRELGSGTYGAVFHGKWKGSDVAIKRIKASCFAGRPSERERLIADFWKEALILSSLHHPNVVSFYGIVRDGPDGSLATVTEFMVNGSLKQFLQKKDRTIDRRKRLIIAMDASFGMEYLHGKNIVHFDLKCENLLVNMRDPHRPICKIGDLGLSKVKQHTLVSGGVRGTLPWMAPELLSGKSHMVTEKIDVYSFGIVMWELLTGDEPYGDLHCASIIGGIVNNSLRPTIPTWCDPEWKALMGSCWSSDPTERPSFSEISQKLRTMAAAINVK